MTDFDYPPSQEYTLGAVLDKLEAQVADQQATVDDLEPDDEEDEVDDEQALREARVELESLETHRDGVRWAVHGDDRDGGFDGWGEDATVVLQAYTGKTRADVVDTLRNEVLGTFGERMVTNWMIAAGIEDAPWIDDKDIMSKAAPTEQLPPPLLDWLEAELDDLNDLSAGN